MACGSGRHTGSNEQVGSWDHERSYWALAHVCVLNKVHLGMGKLLSSAKQGHLVDWKKMSGKGLGTCFGKGLGVRSGIGSSL